MSKNGILRKIARKTNKALTAGALALTAYGCGNGGGGIIEPTPKPTANFNVNPRDGYAPLNSCFDGSSSRAPESSISKYIWRFGDGAVDSTSGVNVCHPYLTPGNPSPTLTVENTRGERSAPKLEQIVVRDPSPVINMPNLSSNEDEASTVNLTGKITSPVNANLTVTATSPELNITMSGSNMNYKNKTKDWNGSTYIDITARDSDGRQANQRVPVNITPQTDVRGYLEHVLTGARIQNISVAYLANNAPTDINGEFDFQAAVSNDTLRIDSPTHYKVRIPINANGQDVDLGNVQLIDRYTDPATGEDLLDFMQTYMLPSRWADADLPIKVFIDNGPPSPEYREAVRRGIMDLWQPVINQWLPEGRKITLAEIVPADPVVGNKVIYQLISQNLPNFHFVDASNIFKKGIIEMDPTQVGEARIRTAAHESGHAFGFLHSPYLNHIMKSANPSVSTPSSFEGLAVATKYKLKKDAVGFYSK